MDEWKLAKRYKMWQWKVPEEAAEGACSAKGFISVLKNGK